MSERDNISGTQQYIPQQFPNNAQPPQYQPQSSQLMYHTGQENNVQAQAHPNMSGPDNVDPATTAGPTGPQQTYVDTQIPQSWNLQGQPPAQFSNTDQPQQPTYTTHNHHPQQFSNMSPIQSPQSLGHPAQHPYQTIGGQNLQLQAPYTDHPAQQQSPFLNSNQQQPQFSNSNHLQPQFSNPNQQQPQFLSSNQQQPQFSNPNQQQPQFLNSNQQPPQFSNSNLQQPQFASQQLPNHWNSSQGPAWDPRSQAVQQQSQLPQQQCQQWANDRVQQQQQQQWQPQNYGYQQPFQYQMGPQHAGPYSGHQQHQQYPHQQLNSQPQQPNNGPHVIQYPSNAGPSHTQPPHRLDISQPFPFEQQQPQQQFYNNMSQQPGNLYPQQNPNFQNTPNTQHPQPSSHDPSSSDSEFKRSGHRSSKRSSSMNPPSSGSQFPSNSKQGAGSRGAETGKGGKTRNGRKSKVPQPTPSSSESESDTGYGEEPPESYSSDEQYSEPEVNQTPTKEINILLLGETGVGKSTWINGLANYLTFNTLEHAIRGQMKVLIPSQFTMTNDDYEEVTIAVGDNDSNEVHSSGQSATQHPVTYKFMAGRTLVRLIDTPGIGDTRGIQQDKINFQNIMNHLAHIDELHGICILLKPNNARISILFEFCIKELLTHLHRDAAANIAFCFTNARSTFYRPGDTLVSLKALLNDGGKSKPLVKLERDTIYCLDNESFRFLAAVKHGENFDDNAQKNYTESWTVSVAETARLIKYFEGIKPHKTTNTLTLNSTRQIIVKLAKPLAEISQNIQTNISVLMDRAKELQDLMARGDDLKGKLNIPQVNLETYPLDYPKTVCASPECTEKISVYEMSSGSQVFQVNYNKQVCHDHCYIQGVQTDELNCIALQGCACMGPGYKCKECSHSWEIHMHITYDTEQVVVQTVDQNVASEIQTTSGRIAAAESVVAQCEQKKMEYEAEQDIITKSAARFAVFLKQNSITPYNDAIIRYLDHMIETEQEKIQKGGATSTVGQLQELRQVYLQEEKILLEAINNPQGASNISLQTIQDSLKELFDLPLSGQTIKNLMNTAQQSARQCYAESPTIVQQRVISRSSKSKSNQGGKPTKKQGWMSKQFSKLKF